MFKDLLLPITHTAGDVHARAAAVTLASRLAAHLTVLETVNLPVPMATAWSGTPDVMLAEVYAQLRDSGTANAAALRESLAAEGIAFDVHIAEAQYYEPPHAVAMYARYADLTILPSTGTGAGEAPIVAGFFNALLFESGRPVLVIPSQRPFELPIRHVVVAWQPTREASRALHEALPFLEAAQSIDVLSIEPGAGEPALDPTPGRDIAAHLRRHELEVNLVTHRRQHESVASALLAHAEATNAQLLVAGGYGHSRLREWVLGGTTWDLVRTATLPILLSH